MLRRFDEHTVRHVVHLEGVWDFAFLGDVDPDDVDVEAIAYDDRMPVPGCFDATPAYAGKRGLAAYRRQIKFVDAAPHRLILDGVHHWCRVFLDGEPVGDHAGGFTPFAVDLTDQDAGVADFVVLVDNRLDYERSPLHHEYFDWYHFGGIARGAELHRLGSLWIDDVRVTTVSIEPPEIEVTVAYAGTEVPDVAPLTVNVDGEKVLSQTVSLSAPQGRIVRRLTLPEAKLWSPAAPVLYGVEVRLGDDDYNTRIGLRQVSVEGREIRVNGEAVRLLGFNRHAAHPQFGHAVPEMVMASDVQQLQDMGCNFVRGSHYPQDARFLDLCDEAGILVWSEAIGWQHTAEHLTDQHFIDAQLAHIDEMIAAAANHPSVIMWGILNESHSHDPACRTGYQTLLERIRERDSSRPVTYASNHPFEDVCLDLVDIVSVNCYPGWYGSEIELIPEEIDKITEHLDEHDQADKPLIISEIGAGAIRGWRDWNGARWTEQYQSRLLETVIRHLFIERDRFAGLAIWQFCDIRSSEAVRKILGRPRGFNNKGVVDEYRRPKEAYEVVKQLFRDLSD